MIFTCTLGISVFLPIFGCCAINFSYSVISLLSLMLNVFVLFLLIQYCRISTNSFFALTDQIIFLAIQLFHFALHHSSILLHLLLALLQQQ